MAGSCVAAVKTVRLFSAMIVRAVRRRVAQEQTKVVRTRAEPKSETDPRFSRQKNANLLFAQ
jgi:hypothetical protein